MRLIKYLCFACILLLSAWATAACEAVEQPTTAEPEAPTVYYSDYLGLSISVPPGWQVNALSANLSAQQGETAAPWLIEYADGSRRLELIDMQNNAHSSVAEHSRFYAYAELLPEPVETAQYVELLTKLLEGDNSGYTYTLLNQEQLQLSRHTAERLCLQVSSNTQHSTTQSTSAAGETTPSVTTPDEATTNAAAQVYIEEYYIIALPQAFMIFYINYWPQSEASRAAAFSVLESITLPEPH